MLARSAHVTLNTIIQAAWSIVDSRLTGRDTVLFGAVETVRPPELEHEGMSGLIGVQLQIQPVLSRLDDTQLQQWLAGLQAQAGPATIGNGTGGEKGGQY